MAIAYDNQMTASGTGSASGDITTSGTNEIIFATVCNATDNTGVATPTVDSNAMTAIDTAVSAGASFGLYYYVGTSAGSHTVAVSLAGKSLYLQVTSYNGAGQTGVPNAHTSENGNTPKTTTLTTTLDNCWCIIWGSNFQVGTTITSGATQRSQTAGCLADSNGPKTPAGDYSIILSDASPPHLEYVLMAAFAPVTEGGAIPSRLASMHVG